VPQILLMNKIDLTPFVPGIERDEYDKILRVRVSARTGAGLEDLRAALAEVAHEHAAASRAAAAPPGPGQRGSFPSNTSETRQA
jgi:GTP-binding protein HflX